MYTYTTINDETFLVTDNKKYKATWNGDESKAQEVVDMLNLQDLNMRKEAKKQQLADLRYVKETSGITFNGNFIKTDRESYSQLNKIYNATRITNSNVSWKINTDWITLTSNEWITLTPDELESIFIAVFNYIQACFDNEKTLSQAIDQDIDTDISQGWPSQTIEQSSSSE